MKNKSIDDYSRHPSDLPSMMKHIRSTIHSVGFDDISKIRNSNDKNIKFETGTDSTLRDFKKMLQSKK